MLTDKQTDKQINATKNTTSLVVVNILKGYSLSHDQVVLDIGRDVD